MDLQSATWFMRSIMSRPNNIWPGIFCLVLWYINLTTKAAADRIHIHGLASSTYVSCWLYVHTRLHSTWRITSMIELTYGFPGEYILVLIKYSSSIKLFLNFWPRNYLPWSSVISTGHVYRTRHVYSTKLAIVIAFLSLYCITSNHPITGSTIVADFNIRGYLPFLHIL